MSIGSIGGFNGFVPGYAASRIPSVSVEEVQKQDLQRQAQENAAAVTAVSREETAVQQPRRDAALEDISLTFNKQDSFEHIGRDSDIRSLDMQRAISDMQKDQVLQQYNFFVGSSRNLMEESPDGVVIPKW